MIFIVTGLLDKILLNDLQEVTKIMLADYLIFHNHLFFTNISKKSMQTIRTLPNK